MISGWIREDIALDNPGEELARRDELADRLRWLVRLRWIALICVFVAILIAHLLKTIVSPWPLVLIASLMLLLNLGFARLHNLPGERLLRALTTEALLQIAVDIMGLGALLFFSGGLSNPFVFFFTHHIVISAILLNRRRAYLVALLTSGVLAMLWIAEQLPWLGSWGLRGTLAPVGPEPPLAHLGLVFVVATTLIFSAYVVGSIGELLRGRNRDVRRLNADLADRVEMLASAEKQLTAEHERARAILECMDEGVVVVDLYGQVLLSNSAAQNGALKMLDLMVDKAGLLRKEEKETGQTTGDPEPPSADATCSTHSSCPDGDCLSDYTDDKGMLSAEGLALLGGDAPIKRPEVRLTAPPAPRLLGMEWNKRNLEVTVSAVRTSEKGTLGLVLVTRDVTERQSLQKQVLHAEKLHAVGNLAAGVAHELNTPLGTILGYVQMLLEDTQSGKRTDPTKELHTIEDQVRRCRHIVQGMLDFARKSGSERRPLQPGQLLKTATNLTAHSLQMRGVQVELSPRAHVCPTVLGADNELEQVLVNLITNAADAICDSPSAGRTENAGKVRLSADRDPAARQIVIAVEDNGPGIPENLREEIFEPFFTTKVNGKGTGLGLSIARRIIEDHGGSLRLTKPRESESGSRFEIWLPEEEKGRHHEKSWTAS